MAFGYLFLAGLYLPCVYGLCGSPSGFTKRMGYVGSCRGVYFRWIPNQLCILFICFFGFIGYYGGETGFSPIKLSLCHCRVAVYNLCPELYFRSDPLCPDRPIAWWGVYARPYDGYKPLLLGTPGARRRFFYCQHFIKLCSVPCHQWCGIAKGRVSAFFFTDLSGTGGRLYAGMGHLGFDI